MSRRLLPKVGGRVLTMEDAERQIRNLQERIDEMQKNPLLSGKFVAGIELPNNTNVPIKHGLGRIAKILASPPYAVTGSVTPGLVRDRVRLLTDKFDPTQYSVLYADTVGTTVYVDALFY